MKIGDEVYIHGYIDEIRNDVVIIRNEGGYFGTVPSEVNCSEIPNNCETCIWSVCNYNKAFEDEQLDKDTNVRSKDCDTCKWGEWYRKGYDITMMDDECGGCCSWNNKWTPKTEPQKCYLRKSCDHYGDKQVCGRCREYNLYSHTKTEPQTDEEYINNLPWTEVGNGEQTGIEIARAIVHKAIDDTPIAEDAYPDLRQKMHDAVDNYEPRKE